MESQAKTGHSPSGHDRGNKYRKLIETEEFKELIQRKKAFIVPVTLFFLALMQTQLETWPLHYLH